MMAETGYGRVDRGGRIGLPGRLGAGKLSLADSIGPPSVGLQGKRRLVAGYSRPARHVKPGGSAAGVG